MSLRTALRSLSSTIRPPAILRAPVGFQFLRMASTLPKLPVFEAIASHDPQTPAVIHSSSGRRFKYGGLLNDVAIAKDKLRQAAGGQPLEGQRIAFLVENGYDYVVTLLSILGSNSIAVPLSPGFPSSELRYILANSEAMMLLSSPKFQVKAEEVIKEGLDQPLKLEIVEKRLAGSDSADKVRLENLGDDVGGMMLYTSGTTNRPKGVLLPNSALTAQSQSLLKAWNYTSSDHLLHVLPLHHIHGTVNALLTPLFAGSCVEFLFPFNVSAVWDRLAAPFLPSNPTRKPPITFLTAVPTIYNRLLSSHPELKSPTLEASKEALKPSNLRLNISGSAALPTPTKAAWTELSNGNVLLERYGMTEVGMALSCGLDFADRVDGSVGWPLPFVEARLVDTETGSVIQHGEEKDADGKEREGEIQLRGPTVFKEYWRNEKATAAEFVEGEDGKGRWFKTGDVATRREVDGAGRSGQGWAKGPMYFIRGRKSVDIIKSGGEKVSALEIERELLSLPQISEAAVVGLASEQWGQKVAAVIVLRADQANSGRGGRAWGVMDMRRALKDRLAGYKIPQEMKVVEVLPKNAMGKINKKSLVKEVFGADAQRLRFYLGWDGLAQCSEGSTPSRHRAIVALVPFLAVAANMAETIPSILGTPRTTMPPRDHFPGMVQLSPSVYLYTPSDQTYVPSDRSAPKLVILCAWMNASATHITKYIVGYQALFPTSSILLIRSSAPDILYRSVSTLRRRIEPALAVVQSTCSQEPSKPEILLHAFSNGGSHHAINLLRYHLSSTGQTLPLHAKVLDSCPGRGNFRRSYLALSAPFERQPLYIRLVGSILVVLTLCLYWVFMFSLRLENPIEAIRQELNDKSMSRETKRIYIYSDTDRMVHWKEVEDHAEDARNKGFMVELERFEGSEHASHVRVGGGERYWRIVKDLWQEQSKT